MLGRCFPFCGESLLRWLNGVLRMKRVRKCNWLSAIGITSSLIVGLKFTGQELLLLDIALGLIVSVVALNLAYRVDQQVRLSAATLLFGLYWIWMGLSVSWSEATFSSIVAFLTFGALPLLALQNEQEGSTSETSDVLAPMLVVVGICLVSMQVWQLWHGHDPSGPFLNRNSLAAFLSLILFLTASRMVIGSAAVTVPGAIAYAAALALAFGIGVTGGRGVLVGMVAGSAIMFTGMWGQQRSRARLLGWAGSALLGLVLANLWSGGALGGRIASLENPMTAGADRFLIWEAALKMFWRAPNLGSGTGTFWLAYPPFRSVHEGSGGFYVHNDYLQSAVELGWPGGLLLVLALGSVLVLVWRLARKNDAEEGPRAEALALAGGLVACAVHSLFTFNFYVPSVLMAFGLMLGRLLGLGRAMDMVSGLSWRPSDWFSPSVWRLVVVLVALVPLVYLGAMGFAHVLYDHAEAQARRGDLIAADRTLQRVTRLLPRSDAAELGRASLFHSILRRNPEMPEADRKAVLHAALESLKHAQRVNPLRPNPWAIRGELLSENTDLATDTSSGEIIRQFRKALSLNPLYVRARMDLATYLVRAKNDPEGARRVLEAGADYQYPPRGEVVRYLGRLASLRRSSGDEQGARALEERMRRYSAAMVKEKNNDSRRNWWDHPVVSAAAHSS